MYAEVSGLQPSLNSIYGDDGGQDCQATYGCGMHLHEQEFECTTPADAGSPIFGTSNPWGDVGYLSTDANGDALFVDCVDVGTSNLEDQTFVVHDNEGNGVACGVLESAVLQTRTPAPVQAPPPPTTRMTSAPTTTTASPTNTMKPTTETAYPTKSPAPTRDPAGPNGSPPSGAAASLVQGLARHVMTATLLVVAVFCV